MPPMALRDWLFQLLKTVTLIMISMLFMPVSSILVLSAFIYRFFQGSQYNKFLSQDRRKTVLVTGVGMAKGLFLARAFAKAGHRVIGADFEPYNIPCSGRFSAAVSVFYRLKTPQDHEFVDEYVNSLLDIVQRESVDMWISCSGVCTAVEDGLARDAIERETSCLCAQTETNLLKTLHMKDAFEACVASLGLAQFTPGSTKITDKNAVYRRLQDEPGQTFIIKVIDPDIRRPMKPFPMATKQQTRAYVDGLDISENQPYQMQKYINGAEYCTHALMIRGEVKAFVACESCDLVQHYKAIPSTSPLAKDMLNFTTSFAGRLPHPERLTGHFSLDFMVENLATDAGVETKIYVIECNPRAHTAVVLFENVSNSLVSAYLELLDPAVKTAVVQPKAPSGHYWAGWDLVSLVLFPALQILTGSLSFRDFIKSAGVFLDHILFWKEATFDVSDPLPLWTLYHLHWPGYLLGLLVNGKQWTRLNVSTMRYWLGEHTG